MFILNIASAIKEMSINEITDFIFETYYIKKLGFLKKTAIIQSNIRKYDLQLFTINAKEHAPSFASNKKTKPVKQ